MGGFFIATFIKFGRLWLFYVGRGTDHSLLLSALVVARPANQVAAIAGAASLAGTELIVFFMAHYAAPIAAVIVAVLVQGMRHLRTCRYEGKPTGLFLVRALVVICVLMVPL